MWVSTATCDRGEFKEMMKVIAEQYRVLAEDPQTLRRRALFHWWPWMEESV